MHALLIVSIVDFYPIALGGVILIFIQDLVLIDLNYLRLGSMSSSHRPDAFLPYLIQQCNSNCCQGNSSKHRHLKWMYVCLAIYRY